MSTFTSCQIAYDNMLPSSYYELDEGDYHMEDMSYEDLEDIVNEPPYCSDDPGDSDEYQNDRKRVALRLMNAWPKCSCCGEPLPNKNSKGECDDCLNYVEE